MTNTTPTTTTPHLHTIDLHHLWHPFTQTTVWQEDNAPIIDSAEGMYLIDTDGNRYLDGVSSLWCNVHGHSVPELTAALSAQAAKLCHSTILGLSHRPIVELTEELISFLPKHLTRVFYSDSGSAAVEAALRMSLEWWHKSPKAKKSRSRLISLDTGYHGDTLGAVGVGYVESFHQSLRQVVVPALRVSPPHLFRFYEGDSPAIALERAIAALELAFKEHGDELAAFIVEPLVQGAAGMWTHEAEYLRAIERLCRKHGTHLIIDEVATGFGKTGTMFAHTQAGVSPDLLVMGKGLTAGYLPLSAVAATEAIFEAFTAPPEELKTFFYGQTFAGNPLAAEVARVSLKLIRDSKLLEQLAPRISYYQTMLEEEIKPLPHVDEIRVQGLMTGIELTSKPGSRESYPTAKQMGIKIVREARKRGVIIRPLGNVMVLMPAVAMKENDLKKLVEVTREAITAVTVADSKK